MKPKLLGCCTQCDREVFEVTARNPETREPVKVGAPKAEAVRACFILADGTRMDLTFCAECAQKIVAPQFASLWERVMTSWVASSGAEHPWVKTQTTNAILAMDSMRRWTEVI